MALRRSKLILERSPYGMGVARAPMLPNTTVSRGGPTWPLMPNKDLMIQKEKEQMRRLNRLRALAMGWYTSDAARMGVGNTNNNYGSGAAPGKLP